MESTVAYWRVVGKATRQYLTRVQDRQFARAAGGVKQFMDAFGPAGLADVCAVLVTGAAAACPQACRTADGRVDGIRLVPQMLPVAVRRGLTAKHVGESSLRKRADGEVPAERIDHVLVVAEAARLVVAEALAAGPGLREIRAVLSVYIDRTVAGPALAYAAGACLTASAKPQDLKGIGLGEDKAPPATS